MSVYRRYHARQRDVRAKLSAEMRLAAERMAAAERDPVQHGRVLEPVESAEPRAAASEPAQHAPTKKKR